MKHTETKKPVDSGRKLNQNGCFHRANVLVSLFNENQKQKILLGRHPRMVVMGGKKIELEVMLQDKNSVLLSVGSLEDGKLLKYLNVCDEVAVIVPKSIDIDRFADSKEHGMAMLREKIMLSVIENVGVKIWNLSVFVSGIF